MARGIRAHNYCVGGRDGEINITRRLRLFTYNTRMPISVRYSIDEASRAYLLVGDVTIAPSTLEVKITTSQELWADLIRGLEGGAITAFVTQAPEEGREDESSLYIRDDDGRERVAEYMMPQPIDPSRLVWLPTSTDVISSVHHKHKPDKGEKVAWKW